MRKNRERKRISYWDALTDQEVKEFLKEQVTCRLGLSLNDRPYVVPLAYVYHPEYSSGIGHPWIVRLIMQKGMALMARLVLIYELEIEKITGVIQDIKV